MMVFSIFINRQTAAQIVLLHEHYYEQIFIFENIIHISFIKVNTFNSIVDKPVILIMCIVCLLYDRVQLKQ